MEKAGKDSTREQQCLKPLEGVVDDKMNDDDEETVGDSARVEMKSLAAYIVTLK